MSQIIRSKTFWVQNQKSYNLFLTQKKIWKTFSYKTWANIQRKVCIQWKESQRSTSSISLSSYWISLIQIFSILIVFLAQNKFTRDYLTEEKVVCLHSTAVHLEASLWSLLWSKRMGDNRSVFSWIHSLIQYENWLRVCAERYFS